MRTILLHPRLLAVNCWVELVSLLSSLMLRNEETSYQIDVYLSFMMWNTSTLIIRYTNPKKRGNEFYFKLQNIILQNTSDPDDSKASGQEWSCSKICLILMARVFPTWFPSLEIESLWLWGHRRKKKNTKSRVNRHQNSRFSSYSAKNVLWLMVPRWPE